MYAYINICMYKCIYKYIFLTFCLKHQIQFIESQILNILKLNTSQIFNAQNLNKSKISLYSTL